MAMREINDAVPATLEACPTEVCDCLQLAMAGADLSFEQGLKLATANGAALEGLLAVADQLRRETVGDTITYVVNRNINFTNVCFVGCSFCGFGRGPGAADAYSLSFEEVVRRAREAWERGATEVCIQGGLPRDLDGFYYRDLLRAVKHAIPEIHVHAFSPMEIDYGVLKTGMPLRDYLRMMKDEGLGSIPGTAAEILDDRVRQELSPKQTARRALGRDHHRRARAWHPHYIYDDVRPHRRARRLGAPYPSFARDPETHRWIHGIRSAWFYP